jgi:endonuclease V-like protein UPF0215 family
MTRPLRTVKREIRILGLDFCSTRATTAAVLRGGQFLDGVFTLKNPGRLSGREIAGRIIGTRYFPELRAIMVHDPKNRSNTDTIEKITRLPVVAVSKPRPRRPGFRAAPAGRGRLWVRTSLPDETLSRILSLTTVFGRLPEPARVAHLLAKTRMPKAPFSNEKE